MLPVLKSLGWIAFSFAGMELSKQFPIGYTQTEEYLHHSLLGSALLWRILYQFVAVTLSRFKYYFVWNLAEAGCIASGLGYAGVDAKTGAVSWDSVNNIDFALVECSGVRARTWVCDSAENVYSKTSNCHLFIFLRHDD